MQSADTTHSTHDDKPGAPAFGPSQLVAVAAAACAMAIAGRFFDNGVPVVAAIIVAALVPRVHGWNVRAPIAAMAGLLALFIVRMWPGVEAAAPAAAAEHVVEGAHTLTWLVAVPLLGATAILFMPRQAHATLRATTMTLMFASLLLALPLLRVSMGRGYHFNEDVLWIPRFGIHYHVAVDGISLWLVLLTAVIMPIATYASFGTIQTRLKDWCFALLLLEAGMLGAFLALDLFLFYVFWDGDDHDR